MPLVYFFPDPALSTLRGYVAYMTPKGAVPFFWGQGFDMVTPNNDRQKSLNGLCFVDLVERLWRLTGNDAILSEFYPAVGTKFGGKLNLPHQNLTGPLL